MKDFYDLEASLMNMWNMIDALEVIALSDMEDKDSTLLHYKKIMNEQMAMTFGVYEEAMANERARATRVEENSLSSLRTGLSDSLFKS